MDAIEKRICTLIEENKEKLYAFAEDIYCHGERGYSEFRTAKRAADFLRELGLSPREGLAITGVKATFGKESGPNVALIGELDGILNAKHPCANPENGISHACGHFAQLVSVLGAALALSDPEVAAALDGRVTAFAVPAEEWQTSDVRAEIAATGEVECFAGKSELLLRGEFDDVDIALSNHAHMLSGKGACDLLLGNNAATGFIGKTITIHGRSAHAAAAPHEGINALSAASLGLAALGMVRETFQEKDNIRVHPIIREGGQAVNNIPDRVVVDMMVRALTQEAILEASQKVDRAFEGAAYAVGATIEVEDTQGYMPVIRRPADRVMQEAAALIEGAVVENTDISTINGASTDLGDLTHRLPVLNFTFGGFTGRLHGEDFTIVDKEKMLLDPAKLMALTTYRLLRDGAVEAKKITDDFTPALTMDEYRAYAHKFSRNK